MLIRVLNVPLCRSDLHPACHRQAPAGKENHTRERNARFSSFWLSGGKAQQQLKDFLIIKTINHVVVLVASSLGKELYCGFSWSWNHCRLQLRVLQEINANLGVQVNIRRPESDMIRRWSGPRAQRRCIDKKDFGKPNTGSAHTMKPFRCTASAFIHSAPSLSYIISNHIDQLHSSFFLQ